MNGRGAGSQFMEDNAHPDQVEADDEMLNKMDPSKMDKHEGEETRDKVVLDLRARISKFHPDSPLYRKHDDQHLSDWMIPPDTLERDQALADTAMVILTEWEQTFSVNPKSPGTTKQIQHSITLKEGKAMPKSLPMFRRSLPHRALIQEWVDWMLKHKMIRRSRSTSFQNLLVVDKPGKEPRVCYDARALNDVTIPDDYPPHRMDSLFAKLGSTAVFSALDAASGFWQIPIRPEDQHKAAFRTETGVFEFIVMPFGLKNAPATFTRWMTESFSDLRHIIQVYMDDLLIHSKTLSGHAGHLSQVFKRCQKHGIKLRLSKCEFLKPEVKMLGYVVNQDGVTKNHEKVDAILNYGVRMAGKTRLTSVAQLRCFVGMCQWYRNFHQMFADHIQVLTGLLKKGKSVKKDWKVPHQLAFDQLKVMLAEKSLLYYPDENENFIIQTDASKFAIGGVLMQKQKTKPGEPERFEVVEYYSRSLLERERNYTVSEKEFLAIVCCSERWNHYLWKEFTIVTDHKPLLSISLTEKARLQRWALRLTKFNFEITWLPGELMAIADALSRDPGLETATMICNLTEYKGSETEERPATTISLWLSPTEPVEPPEKYLETETPIPLDKNPTLEIEDAKGRVTTVKMVFTSREEPEDDLEILVKNIHPERQQSVFEQEGNDLIAKLTEDLMGDQKVEDLLRPGTASFYQEQQLDPLLVRIRKKLESRRESKVNSTQSNFSIHPTTDLLMWKNPKGAMKIVVPEQMVDNILWMHHEHALAGHPGARKMVEAIRNSFYVKNLTKRAQEWVKHCQCQRAKAKIRGKAGLTLTRPMPEIFSWLIIDFVGPFPRSRHGKYMWLTMLDAFSKDLELVALNAKSALGVAKAILEVWICRRGCPRVILSDNAQEFVGEVVGHLCDLLAISRQTVTTYHHPSNGLVERIHNYAHSIMKAAQVEHLSDWDTWLPFIRFAITTHEVDNSGVSPFQITYGLRPTLPADLTANNAVLPTSMRAYYEKAQRMMDRTRRYFRVERAKTRLKNRLTRDRTQNRYRDHFKIGELVLVHKPSYTKKDGVKALHKIIGGFKGPFRIVGTDAHNGVDVDVDGKIQHFNVEHVNRTKELVDREPPAYTKDRLSYDWQPQEEEPVTLDEELDLKSEDPEEEPEVILPLKRAIPKPRAEEKERTIQRFQILHDVITKKNYAAELVVADGIPQAKLSLAGKGNSYDPIWFNTENAEETKCTKQKPKGNWLPWMVPIDGTWLPVGPVEAKMRKLKRSAIKSNTPPAPQERS
jgi:hypothetical protein